MPSVAGVPVHLPALIAVMHTMVKNDSKLLSLVATKQPVGELRGQRTKESRLWVGILADETSNDGQYLCTEATRSSVQLVADQHSQVTRLIPHTN